MNFPYERSAYPKVAPQQNVAKKTVLKIQF